MKQFIIASIVFAFLVPATTEAQVIYSTDFDDLSLGQTENPANTGHDEWTSIFHPGNSFGAIQNVVSNGGNAIQQFTDITNTNGQQSIDNRSFSSVETETTTEVVFEIDFYSSSSDLNTRNSYAASASVRGDGEVFGFSIRSGNGQLKSDVGVSVGLATFNGVDNNEPISLTVGRNLAWDAWHELQLRADLSTNQWLSISVNGDTQPLDGIALPRNFPGGVPTSATFMDRIELQVVNVEGFGDETSDSVFFDNVSLDIVPVSGGVTPPDSFNVFRGTLIGGDLADVQESDDARMRFNPGFTINSDEAPVWLIFDASLSNDSPNSLELVLESQAGTPGLTGTLEAFNWISNAYEIVDETPASFNNDTEVSVDLNSGIGKYVQAGTGAVRSRIGWRQTGFTINFPWEVRLDQLVWTVD